MTDLTGRLISNTYKQLILVSSAVSNEGVDTSLKPIQTGDGTNTALKVATNAVQVSGALGVAGSVSFDMPSYIYGASRERYVPFPYFDTTPLKGIGVKLKEDGETVEVFMIGSCSREQADKLNHKYNRLRMDSTAGGHCIRASR